jgi:predicted Fe-S protein YdhL (DUF1289 family)
MTNTNGCRHIGKKTDKDWSICLGTFRKIDHFSWLKFIDSLQSTVIISSTLEKEKEKEKEKEQEKEEKELLRQKRLAYYSGGSV